MNIGDIEDVIQTGLAGKAATEIWEGEKHFSIVVRLPEAQRSLAKFPLPHGWFLTWGGEFESQQRAMKRLSIIVPISIFLIFVMLFDAFKSVKSALLILVNVPMGLIGGIFALLLTGIPLSVSGSIGFIALFGQAVLNGVVMVSCFNQLQDEGLSTYESVFQGAVNHLCKLSLLAEGHRIARDRPRARGNSPRPCPINGCFCQAFTVRCLLNRITSSVWMENDKIVITVVFLWISGCV